MVSQLDVDDTPTVLVVLGVLSIVFGVFFGGWFWGGLIGVGVSWIIAGGIYSLAERDLTEGAFLAGLVFGVFGAIIWIVIDMSRSQGGPRIRSYEDKYRYYKRVAQENYRCGKCYWFDTPGCKRKETLINAEPCKDFRL